ncbi:Gfo/Idh/MocA family oxidoreductase, partial [Exiguobacterium sp. SH31]|uniref:Gfo/Idh/MocA family oxidoreductase n=1 Tax=Exiguobacterium sp. SH31 TaxID=1843183 RepID=UPI00336BDE1D
MSLYFYSLYLNSENIFKLIVVCLAIIPVILLRPFIGKYYDFVTLRKLKSAYKNDTRWPRDVTLQLDETGVHVSSSFKSGIKKTDVPWDSIKVVGEDDGHFFLYYETNEAIIVPKFISSLTESENIAFYDLIEQRLNNDFKNAEQGILFMRHGKHVLCEKPFASNVDEVKLMLETAREHDVVLLEALRNLFMPNFQILRQALPRVGPVRRVILNKSQYSSRYDLYKRGDN